MKPFPLLFALTCSAAFQSCERMNLRPEPAVSLASASGTVDGVPFEWDAASSAQFMDLHAGGCTAGMVMPSASLMFHWHVPSGSATEEALRERVVEGTWPLTSLASAGEVEWGDLLENHTVIFNSELVEPSVEASLFNPLDTNLLNLFSWSNVCSDLTQFVWFPAQPCQTQWMESTFSVEWENSTVVLEAPESGDWEWEVNASGTWLAGDELELAQSPDDYIVSMRPANPHGAWGDFIITRQFPGEEEAGCFEELEFDLEVEVPPYFQVVWTPSNGLAYASDADCDGATLGSFEALEVESVESESAGLTYRLVQFSCDVEVQHGADVLPIALSGTLAFPVGD